MKDTLINYALGIGVPKLIFKITVASNKYKGAAAITYGLHSMSMKKGIENGVGVFVFIGIITFQVTAYCLFQYYKNKIETDISFLKLRTTDAILTRIDTYPISNKLQKKLKSNYLLPNY